MIAIDLQRNLVPLQQNTNSSLENQNKKVLKDISNTVYGEPEVRELKKVMKPLPRSDEMLIKIHATTVNRTDRGNRTPEYFIER